MAAALPTRLKAALLQMLANLDLPGLGNRVFDRLAPEESNASFPCLLVTADGLRERLLETGTTETQHKEWPFRVILCDRRSAREHQAEVQLRDWRTTVLDAFHEQHRPGAMNLVPELYWCLVEPELIFDPNWKDFQHMLSGMVVKFWTSVPRRGPYPF